MIAVLLWAGALLAFLAAVGIAAAGVLALIELAERR